MALIGAAVLAYANSLHGPLVFDDISSIAKNASIVHLWPPDYLLHPPADTSVSGRPVLNFSFAVNYAIGGTQVRGYHVTNLLIHILAGLTLFGLVRRTLHSATLAFAVALLWTIHPLQTESVTYLVQRAESLMGLFYFLTLYCFVRQIDREKDATATPTAQPGFFWLSLSVLSCLLGMGTKEVMASAPVMVLLYDRAFVAGTFWEAWRRRRGYYLSLAATWILLAELVLGTKGRSGTVGFEVGVPWHAWLLTQGPAVARYLGLSVWPRGQIIDYGTQWVRQPAEVLPAMLLVAALLVATAWAFWRRPRWGFLGAFFFAILAPTSLVPGIRQTSAEHRMYLALAPVLVLLVLMFGRAVARLTPSAAARNRVMLAFALVLAVPLAILTARRNAIYRSHVALWSDTVAKIPGNAGARNYLGNALVADGQLDAAIAQFQLLLRQAPRFAEGHNNYGMALMREGRVKEAEAEYRQAIRLQAKFYTSAHNNLGVALAKQGDEPGAVAEFRAILQQTPDYVDVRNNLGIALAKLGDEPGAAAEFQTVLRAAPNYADAYFNYGNALARSGRVSEAVAEYREALRHGLNLPELHKNLGSALLQLDRPREARAELQLALALKPDDTEVREKLAHLPANSRL